MDPTVTIADAYEGAVSLGSTIPSNVNSYIVIPVSMLESLTTEFQFTGSDRLERALHEAGFELAPVDDHGRPVHQSAANRTRRIGEGEYLLYRRPATAGRLSGILVNRQMIEDLRERLMDGELDRLLGRTKPNIGKPMILPHPLTPLVR